MSQNVGKSDDEIIFIVGNPRSKQNLSKIRRHASKAPKSDIPPATPPNVPRQHPLYPADRTERQASHGRCTPPPKLERISSTPAQDPLGAFRISSNDGSRPNFPEYSTLRRWIPSFPDIVQATVVDTAAAQYRLDGASSWVLLGRPMPIAWDSEPSGDPKRHSPSPPTGQQIESRPRPLRLPRRRNSFTTAGTTVGTWFEDHPAKQAAATFDHDFDPHKRAKLSDRYNATDPLDDLPSPDRDRGILSLPKPVDSAYARSLQSYGSSMLIRQHSSLDNISSVAARSCLRKRKFDALHMQWRVGAAPPRPLPLSAIHASFEHILLRTSAYYTSRYDSTWQPLLIHDPQALDSDGRVSMLYESNLTIAALIEAGRPTSADLIIQRNLSIMEELLRSEHPRLYSVIAVMALDTHASVLGQYHRKFVEAIIPLARTVLGDSHPCTLLLQCDLPPDTKARLHEAVQKRIHELHLATFGDVHQTHESMFIVGRILAQLGQIEQALSVLAWLKPRWEGAHGMNSMLAVYNLVEEATIYLSAGQADVRTEMIVCDALRRLKILESNARHLPETEKRKYLMGLGYLQVGARRALGRMHIMRKNLGAALESYRQAVTLAEHVFGEDAPATQLVQGDYDRAKASGTELGTAAYPPSEKGEEELEVLETILGKITRSKTAFGMEAVKVPVGKATAYGFVPYEDLRWREGLGVA